MRKKAQTTEVGLHPVSGHRTPDQLTHDAAGPMARPDLDVKVEQPENPQNANVANGETDTSPLGTPSKLE